MGQYWEELWVYGDSKPASACVLAVYSNRGATHECGYKRFEADPGVKAGVHSAPCTSAGAATWHRIYGSAAMYNGMVYLCMTG